MVGGHEEAGREQGSRADSRAGFSGLSVLGASEGAGNTAARPKSVLPSEKGSRAADVLQRSGFRGGLFKRSNCDGHWTGQTGLGTWGRGRSVGAGSTADPPACLRGQIRILRQPETFMTHLPACWGTGGTRAPPGCFLSGSAVRRLIS